RPADRILDADLPPVDREIEAGQVTGAVDEAQGLVGGSLRPKVHVGHPVEPVGRLAVVTLTSAGALDEAGGHAGHGAALLHLGAGEVRTVSRARVTVAVVGRRSAAVQVADRRRAEALRPVAADQQVLEGLPLEAELAV